MAPHQEEEIKGASNSISDAPFVTQTRKSQRSIRLPERYREEARPNSSTPKKRHSQNTSKPSTKRENGNSQTAKLSDGQTSCSPLEIISSVDEKPIKQGKKRAEPSWMSNYRSAKSRDDKFAVLEAVNSLHINQPFPQKMALPEREPTICLPPEVSIELPFTVWEYFLSQKSLGIMSANTNLNARLERAEQDRKLAGDVADDYNEEEILQHRRPWTDTTADEIGAYLGALLLIGCQPARGEISCYWDTSEDTLIYPLAQYLSLVRFQQIQRYFKCNDPRQQCEGKDWWKKVEPLATEVRKASLSGIYIPSHLLSVDEQLVTACGRSKDTLDLSSCKNGGKGFKDYSTCDARGPFVLDWIWTSKVTGPAEIHIYRPQTEAFKADRKMTATESVVMTLAQRVQDEFPNLQFGLALDNYFTTHRLYAELRAIGIPACGTAKDGSGIPREFVLLKDCASKEKHYGRIWNVVLQEGVNQICFIDSVPVLMMSTLHDVVEDELKWREVAKRPRANLKFARREEGQQDFQLPYYLVSYDYNYHMGGSDIASQIWTYYTTSTHSHRRNWFPLLYQVLDTISQNGYTICRLAGSKITHKEFQLHAALTYLRRNASTTRKRKRTVRVYNQRPTIIPQVSECTWEDLPAKVWCRQCSAGQGRGRPRKLLGDITNTIASPPATTNKRQGHKTSSGCKACKVALCRERGRLCWDRYHAAQAQGNETL